MARETTERRPTLVPTRKASAGRNPGRPPERVEVETPNRDPNGWGGSGSTLPRAPRKGPSDRPQRDAGVGIETLEGSVNKEGSNRAPSGERGYDGGEASPAVDPSDVGSSQGGDRSVLSGCFDDAASKCGSIPRTREPTLKHTSLRLDECVVDLLKVIAIQRGTSLNVLVLEAIDEKLRGLGYPSYAELSTSPVQVVKAFHSGPKTSI